MTIFIHRDGNKSVISVSLKQKYRKYKKIILPTHRKYFFEKRTKIIFDLILLVIRSLCKQRELMWEKTIVYNPRSTEDCYLTMQY